MQDEDREDYIGLIGGGDNIDVMGKKKRVNKERQENGYYDEISGSDAE